MNDLDFSDKKMEIIPGNKYIVITLLPTTINISVVLAVKNDKPKILFTVSENLVYEKKDDSSNEFVLEYLTSLNKACNRVTYKIDTDMENIFFLESAFIFLEDPWVDFKIKNIVDEKVVPFSVNNEYFKKIDTENSSDSDYKFHISAKINDYNVDLQTLNLSDKNKVKKVELNILEQKIKSGFRESVKYIVENNFLLSNIIFDTYYAAVDNAVALFMPKKRDKIVLNIYNEFTLMKLYIDSELDSVTKIPLGTNKIVKKIKEVGRLGKNNTAIKILDSILVGEKTAVKDIVLKLFKKQKKEYISYINKILFEYDKYEIPPNIITITSDVRSFLATSEDIFGPSVMKVNLSLVERFVDFSNIKYLNVHIAVALMYLFYKD